MAKKVHKEIKKLTPPKKEGKVGLYLQLILTALTIISGISYLINNKFLSYLQLFFALDMFIMSYNNHSIYKRKTFTILYAGIGAVVLGIMIVGLLG